MDKYENLGLVGEGSYGVVMKCRHKETRELVAIKKFLESEDDRTVRKIALREIKLLKLLRHDNLVKILEVFRRKKRLYLVFEFIDRTVLDDLERYPRGLDETYAKKILFQVIRGIEFCHQKDIIHRDVKPENILVTKDGIVKVCDFGFARVTAGPGDNLTDYVATRWYRAPELIVGDCNYGKPVDVWAMGCLYSEMLNGDPLFPGDSDIDQLHHIIKCLGNLPARYEDIFRHNPIFRGVRFPEVKSFDPFDRRYPRLSKYSRDFVKQCLQLDANDRPTCSLLLEHDLFQREGFASRFLSELRMKLSRDDVNRSPNLHRKAPSRDQSPSKSKPKIPGRSEMKKEESSVGFSFPNPQTGATGGLMVEVERIVAKSPAPPTTSEAEPAVSPAPPPLIQQEEPMDTTRLSVEEEPPAPQVSKKPKAPETTPLPMPPIAGSTTNAQQSDERSSPVHVSTMTPAFPSSPTPQSFGTGPPPLKVSDGKVKKLSLYKKAPAFPNPGHQTMQPTSQPPSQPGNIPGQMETSFKPSGFYAFNLTGQSRTVERSPGHGGSFTLPALKGSEMPLNKPPGHTPSGKPKKDFWSTGLFRR